MGSTRALFASLGVSVSLVAAAALCLFVLTIGIGFGGWSLGISGPDAATTLVFGMTEASHAAAAKAAASSHRRPVVLRAPSEPRPRRAAAHKARVAAPAKAAAARVISHPAVVSARPPQVVVAPPAAIPAPVPAAPKPATGDGVRRVGEGLSSKVQSTATVLSAATAPLGPPISSAVKKVLDLVAVLLQRTTDTLAGALDAVGALGRQ